MTEPLAILFELRAAREVEDIDAWWRVNRQAAPDLFMSELERMLGILALMPSVGAPAKSARVRDVRRVRLGRSCITSHNRGSIEARFKTSGLPSSKDHHRLAKRSV